MVKAKQMRKTRGRLSTMEWYHVMDNVHSQLEGDDTVAAAAGMSKVGLAAVDEDAITTTAAAAGEGAAPAAAVAADE